jgi:MFS family permease
MQDAALRWYVQLSTRDVGSEFWLGLTAAVAAAPIVVFSPLGGAVADRFPKRRVIASTQSIGVLLAALLGLLVWMDRLPLWGALALAALHGSFLAFDIPARQAFTIEMVGRRDLASAIGLNSTVFNLGRLMGPMAMAIVLPIGLAACFLLNGLSFLPLIALLLLAAPPRGDGVLEGVGMARPKGVSDLLAGFRSVFDRPRAKGLLTTLAVFLLTGGSYPTLLAALADYTLERGAAGYSALLASNGLGSVAGALVVASLHRAASRRGPIVAGVGLVSLGLIAASATTTLWIACVSLFAVGAGFILFLASANSTIQLGIPDEIRGRVMSMWVLVFGLALPVGALAAGQLAHAFGTPVVLRAQGVGSIAAVILAFVAMSRPDGPERRED